MPASLTRSLQASRTSCFEMAKLDFSLRQEHYRSVPDHRVYQSQGQFKMFNSAMIAGISAIIDPRGPDGDTMRKILGTFLELNPWAEVKDKDETTRKEVRIVGHDNSPRTHPCSPLRYGQKT